MWDTASVVIGPGVGPSYHTGMLRESETWGAVGNPHIVDVDVYPIENAVLTIRPAVLSNSAAARSSIAATRAREVARLSQSASRTAQLRSHRMPRRRRRRLGHGRRLRRGPATPAGSATAHSNTAATARRGWGEFLVKNPVQVDHCVFRKSADYAIVSLPEFVPGLLAANTLAENVRDGIRIMEGTIAGSVTWEDLGIPYVLDGLTVADSSTLTIKPGCCQVHGRRGSLLQWSAGRNRHVREQHRLHVSERNADGRRLVQHRSQLDIAIRFTTQLLHH